MKTNTAKKVIVSAMAIAMGAGIAGSISGTVAWYQYSTRATVAYQGAAAQCSENLQIRIASGENPWKSDLTTTDVMNYLTSTAGGRTAANYQQLRPVTSGSLAANKAASSFYRHPLYQYAAQDKWGAATKAVDYIEIPLEFRVVKVDGEVDDNGDPKNFLAQDLYITDVTLESTAQGKDVTEAVRIGFAEQAQENAKEITLS